jgi:hypothetical protein
MVDRGYVVEISCYNAMGETGDFDQYVQERGVKLD